MTTEDIILYIGAFLLIWIGSGLTVKSIESIAKRMRMNTFIVSFVILGLFTSLPETFLVINSTLEGRPEVSAGNLLGGIIVLFLLLIPLIAITGNGAKIIKDISKNKLLLSVFVIALPAILLIDNFVGAVEGLIFLAVYSSLIFFVEKKEKTKEVKTKIKHKINKYYWPVSFGKLILGVILIFISSHIILDNTIKLAEVLHVSSFVVSLFLISIGTNLPEFSVGIRSILQKDKNLALGNYIGSAAVNTLLFGVLIFLNPGGIFINDSKFFITAALIILAIVLFYIFTVTKEILSRREGLILLGVYVIFCATQLIEIQEFI